MSSRRLWITAFALCILALVVMLVYSFRAPSRDLLPFLLAVPIAVLARTAWQRLRRAA
jgi:predicted RND superfamily exporter protein